MLKEMIATAKTIEEAVKIACDKLNVDQSKCNVEILEKPKKSIFGKIKVEAKVKVTVKEAIKLTVDNEENVATLEVSKINNNDKKLELAVAYLKDVFSKMDIPSVELEVQQKSEYAVITIKGENLGMLIGRHGETLDALQYLTSLVCNRIEGTYYRIMLNCGNYREKREESLKELAKKISEKVKRTQRSQMLEPMNPYERRIIHAVLSDIEGVTSKSKGEEPNRKIVIYPNVKGAMKPKTFRPNTNRAEDFKKTTRPSYPSKPEKTMEQILKEERSEKEKEAKLYSKIEL